MGEDGKTAGDEGSYGKGEDELVQEWVVGLPDGNELVPMSHSLVPPLLASAFAMRPEPRRTMIDVNLAVDKTIENIIGQAQSIKSKSFSPFIGEEEQHVQIPEIGNENLKENNIISEEENDSTFKNENSYEDPFAPTVKRPRLVWTPHLHKRFVDAVAHVGIKNAVPKTVMQLMNVEGLTRENVASHLQKYRLYLKRMQGLSNDEGPSSSSNHLLPSMSMPTITQSATGHVPIPVPYMAPVLPMPVFGVPNGRGSAPVTIGNPPLAYGFHPNSYIYSEQSRDMFSNLNSSISYPHVTPGHNKKT